jgi:GNAT superfamily N-acetyltransferase
MIGVGDEGWGKQATLGAMAEGPAPRTATGEDFIRRRTTTVTLRDGTLVEIRPVVPEDMQRFVDAFARLSPASRYRRFFAPIEELTPEMVRSFTEVDYVDRFAYVALLASELGKPLIGEARYVRDPTDPEVAEAAVTVIDEYQGRGLGTLLLDALGAVALEHGIRRFSGLALERNEAIRDVLGAVGGRVRFDSPGLVRVEVDLPSTSERLKGTPLYDVFRAVARGDGPIFSPSRIDTGPASGPPPR